LYPEIAGALHYAGASFGGGIGALALPWDRRFLRAYLDVPSFGNHPLRVQLPCTGSGESVRRHYRTHPEALEVLAYFDAATAARHLRIPVFVAAALSDPAVPPPGQFAVYNALAGERELFVRKAAHCEYPEAEEEDREIAQRLAVFFGAR
jgi:cephalosporin-C deacetylase